MAISPAVFKGLRVALMHAAACLAALGVLGAAADAQVPPDEAWRTLETEHFRVTFPRGLEALGRRAGDHAEQALAALAEAFLKPPEGVIDILVTDHLDVSNGSAQLFPSNRITIYARPPVDKLGLGYFDEWLELVVTHELAHILHLDLTVNPLGKLFRGAFGRIPTRWPMFTGFGAPRWSIEGLATWYESRLSDAGRVRGTYHEMVLRTAVLEGGLARLDQAGGDSPVWPGGDRAYVYGSRFFDHVLEKHGEERMSAFVTAVAGQWIPFRMNAAARDAFGTSFSEEWGSWEEELEARYADLQRELARRGPVTRPERLTDGARWALYARVAPDGSTLAYVRSNGRSDTQIRVSDPAGEDARKLTRSNGFATLDWMPGGSLLVSQLEYADPYRAYGDLFVVGPDGSERRLTDRARLGQPSVAPDGTWAVAVQDGGGTNGLVRIDLATGEVRTLVEAERDVHWVFPRIDPGGSWIAVSRWSEGAYLDIVVIDTGGRVVLEVTRDRAMDIAPSWSPDGRHLVWGSDRTGILNIVAAEVNPGAGRTGDVLLVTNVSTGATYPSVDPSGEWLYFSGYHVDGWEIERVPFDLGAARRAHAPAARFTPTQPYVGPPATGAGEATRPYSALPTLMPRYWEPVLEESLRTPQRDFIVEPDTIHVQSRTVLGAAVGAQTSGIDLVGRHAYGALVSFRPSGGTWDGAFAYEFAGLGDPVFSIGVSQFWDQGGALLGRRGDSTLDTLFVLERDRTVTAGVTFTNRTWRRRVALTLSGGMAWEHLELLDNNLEPAVRKLTRPDRRFGDLRATLSFSTARSYAFQMGRAAGANGFVRVRTRGELGVPDSLRGRPTGGDRSFDEVVAQLRTYLPLGGPGHASHVLATRIRVGSARGPGAGTGHFRVGGASGTTESLTGLALFGGRSLSFPVRGYLQSTRFGRLAWSASAEYRFPLALIDRGLGAWPVHADRVIGTLFADAGNAWGPELGLPGLNNPQRDPLASVGTEVTTELLTFWTDALRLRTGVALPLTGAGEPTVYVRLGLSF